MKASEFTKDNKITSTINLKDGRKLYTTNNGFSYWVESSKGVIDPLNEAQYNQSKKHRITKRNK
jgi:hypothetical protein